MGVMLDARCPESLANVNAEFAWYDVSIAKALDEEHPYFIFMPYSYLLRNFTRYALTFFGLSLLFSVLPILIFSGIPWVCLIFYKYSLFTRRLALLNISKKKAWGLLLLLIALSVAVGLLLRRWVMGFWIL